MIDANLNKKYHLIKSMISNNFVSEALYQPTPQLRHGIDN